MLDEMTNTNLIELTLKNEGSTEVELELAYRLRDAIDEIDLLCNEVGVLQVQSELWQAEA